MNVLYEAIAEEVGSVISGSSTAYNIANNGAKQVSLVEQVDVESQPRELSWRV